MSTLPADFSCAVWRRSSYSSGNGGDCVEVADGHPGVVPVQDSKNPGPALVVPAAAWQTFIASLRDRT